MSAYDRHTLGSTFADCLAAETRKEDARLQAHEAEADRHRGTCWSGMGPEPFRARSPEQLRQDAEARAEHDRIWRKTPTRTLLRAVHDVNYACEEIRSLVCRAGTPASLGQVDREKANQILAQMRVALAEAEGAVWS